MNDAEKGPREPIECAVMEWRDATEAFQATDGKGSAAEAVMLMDRIAEAETRLRALVQ